MAAIVLMIIGYFARAKAKIETQSWIDGLVEIQDGISLFLELLKKVADRVHGVFDWLYGHLNEVAQMFFGYFSTIRGLLRIPGLGDVVAAMIKSVVATLTVGVEGPLGPVEYTVEASIGGAVGDLFTAGGQFLAAWEQQLDNEAEDDEHMSIDDFCRQDGGCKGW